MIFPTATTDVFMNSQSSNIDSDASVTVAQGDVVIASSAVEDYIFATSSYNDDTTTHSTMVATDITSSFVDWTIVPTDSILIPSSSSQQLASSSSVTQGTTEEPDDTNYCGENVISLMLYLS